MISCKPLMISCCTPNISLNCLTIIRLVMSTLDIKYHPQRISSMFKLGQVSNIAIMLSIFPTINTSHVTNKIALESILSGLSGGQSMTMEQGIYAPNRIWVTAEQSISDLLT